MAARKSPRSQAATKMPKPATANEADPQSWLYLNPAGPSASGLVFGVLRKSYAGRTNSALEFGWRKAHVGSGHDGFDVRQWSPNVERVEVILPAGADDMLADPAVLLAQMDAGAAECEKALLVYLTLPLGDVDRVHLGWERARAFAGRIARERDLATVLTLHAPGRVNAPFPLHAHCLIVLRRITGLGLRHGLYDEELVPTPTLTDVEKFIASWNREADEAGRSDDRIIGAIVDSAVSMAGFELANAEATTNLLFRINRTSLRQDVFWAIIGHTPKDLKNDDPVDNAISRLRGSAMWSTSPRTVVELRTAGEHENITDVRRVYPELKPRDIVIAMAVKANSKGADCRPRVLRRLTEGAFEDITEAFPSVCESYASSPIKAASSAVERRAAVIGLIRELTGGGTAGAEFTRDDLSRIFRERRDSLPVLRSMTDDARSSSATKRDALAAVIKQLGDDGCLQTTKHGRRLIVKDLGPMLKIAA